MADEWNLILIFPNLVPPVPSPYATDGMYLCSADDPMLQQLEDNLANRTARRMLRRFSTPFGERYRPGCLLVTTDVPQHVLNAEALKAFRNACAIATTIYGWASSIAHPYGAGQWATKWTDSFTFGFYTASRDGNVLTLEGPVRGMDDRLPSMKASPHLSVPRADHLRVDELLIERLMTAWRRYYVSRRERPKFRRLFRSLEAAFYAGLFPGDGITSISDVCTRLALWVSAFEVLFHPGTRNVNKADVQNALALAPLGLRELCARRYTVTQYRQRRRVAFAEKLYDEVYQTRNRFLHGNPVRSKHLLYRGSSRYLSLINVAPLLYYAGLLSFLKGKVDGDPDDALAAFNDATDYREYRRIRAGISELRDALNAVRSPLDAYGRPQHPQPRMRGGIVAAAVEA